MSVFSIDSPCLSAIYNNNQNAANTADDGGNKSPSNQTGSNHFSSRAILEHQHNAEGKNDDKPHNKHQNGKKKRAADNRAKICP